MTDNQGLPVQAKVILIDPSSMTIVWMNEAAAKALPSDVGDAPITIEQVVPLAESLGVPEALRAVSATGVSEHLQTNLVSTTRGSVAVVMSVYRLPDAMLLLVAENAWQPEDNRKAGDSPRKREHRAR